MRRARKSRRVRHGWTRPTRKPEPMKLCSVTREHVSRRCWRQCARSVLDRESQRSDSLPTLDDRFRGNRAELLKDRIRPRVAEHIRRMAQAPPSPQGVRSVRPGLPRAADPYGCGNPNSAFRRVCQIAYRSGGGTLGMVAMTLSANCWKSGPYCVRLTSHMARNAGKAMNARAPAS